MGFLDSAKNKISATFGEETVRVVSFEEQKLSPKVKEKAEKPAREKPKREKPQRQRPKERTLESEEENDELELSSGANSKKKPRRSRGNIADAQPIAVPDYDTSEEDEPNEFYKGEGNNGASKYAEGENNSNPEEYYGADSENSDGEDFSDENEGNESEDSDEESPLLEGGLPAMGSETPVASRQSTAARYSGSAFDVEDNAIEDFLNQQQQDYDDELAKRYEDVPDIQVRDKQIQDVLDVLEIPATFAIETDVFLPEDIQDIKFDLQAPYGFEEGQVNLFVTQTQNTVKKYVALLKLRNEHVAKLASVVDKLQVDANNLRYEKEIANGINVMPSYEAEDIEGKYLELKMENSRLKEELNKGNFHGGLTAQERNRYNDLQDQLSIMRRENEELKEDNYALKNQLAIMQEELDEAQIQDFSQGRDDSEPYMPSVSVDEEMSLPDPMAEGHDYSAGAVESMVEKAATPAANSAFYTEAEDDSPGGIEILDEHGEAQPVNADEFEGFYGEDEDDDEVEKLMREWNK